MSVEERYGAMGDIIRNPNIKVPDYLDDSATSKVLYALGMNGRPTVVADSELDTMDGVDLFRTVYDNEGAGISSADILDQIAKGEYTQLSGSGGSAWGRAIYFATDYFDSSYYGAGETNPMMCRAKFKPNAKIVNAAKLESLYGGAVNSRITAHSADLYALTALANGYDAWYTKDGDRMDYVMVLNRNALAMSDRYKNIDSRSLHPSETWHSNNR